MAASDYRVMTDATGQTLGKDSSLQEIKAAINALPNATQAAADNANNAAADARTAIAQLGGLVAETYSNSKTYKAGDYSYYNGELYRCNNDITTAEAWNSENWVKVALADETEALKDGSESVYHAIIDDTDTVSVFSKWELGDVDSLTGKITGSTIRAHTGLFKFDTAVTLVSTGSWTYRVFNYGADKQYVSADMTWRDSTYEYTLNANTYYRLLTVVNDTTNLVGDAHDHFKIKTIIGKLVENDSIYEAIINREHRLDTIFGYGDISGVDGRIMGNAARAYSINIMKYGKDVTLYFDKDAYWISKVTYEDDGTFIARDDEWNKNGCYIIKKNTNFRLVVALLAGEFSTDRPNLQKMISVFYEDELPDYYYTHINSKINGITEKGSAITNPIQFIFYTDVHMRVNSCHTPEIINNVLGRTPINLSIFGGDIPAAYGSNDDLSGDIKKWCDFSGRIKGNKLFLHGNHDLMTTTTDAEPQYIIRNESEANYYGVNKTDSNLHFTGAYGKRYGYYDDELRKVRFILVDDFEPISFSYGINPRISQIQADWLVNTALNVPSGYTVVVFSHAASDSSLSSYTDYGLNVLQPILEAYCGKTTVSVNYWNDRNSETIVVEKDFSAYNGTISCHICGHSHKDQSNKSNGLLSISTTCDARYADDGIDRTIATISEHAVDVFTIDPQNKIVYATRIGAGSDRGGATNGWTY